MPSPLYQTARTHPSAAALHTAVCVIFRCPSIFTCSIGTPFLSIHVANVCLPTCVVSFFVIPVTFAIVFRLHCTSDPPTAATARHTSAQSPAFGSTRYRTTHPSSLGAEYVSHHRPAGIYPSETPSHRCKPSQYSIGKQNIPNRRQHRVINRQPLNPVTFRVRQNSTVSLSRLISPFILVVRVCSYQPELQRTSQQSLDVLYDSS